MDQIYNLIRMDTPKITERNHPENDPSKILTSERDDDENIPFEIEANPLGDNPNILILESDDDDFPFDLNDKSTSKRLDLDR